MNSPEIGSELGIAVRELGLELRPITGIAEYWVFELKRKRINQMWSPAGDACGEKREIPLGQRIEAATIAGLGIEPRGLG